jgi:hypothetical protein
MATVVSHGGALIRSCSAPGCRTLTLGLLCVSHESPRATEYPRGRPFQRPLTAVPTTPPVAQFRLPRKISA